MKRLIAGLAFVLTLAVAEMAWAVPVLPWTTFSGMAKEISHNQPLPCGMGVLVLRGNVAYMAAINSDGSRVVFYYDPAPNDMGAPPTHYAVAFVNQANRDLIPVLNWFPFGPTTPDPCTLLNLSAADHADVVA